MVFFFVRQTAEFRLLIGLRLPAFKFFILIQAGQMLLRLSITGKAANIELVLRILLTALLSPHFHIEQQTTILTPSIQEIFGKNL